MKLVLVDWVDSHSGRGWRNFDELKETATPLYCRSVGWLLTETKGCFVLVPHIYAEKNGAIVHQGCGDMTIPKRAVGKITVLRTT